MCATLYELYYIDWMNMNMKTKIEFIGFYVNYLARNMRQPKINENINNADDLFLFNLNWHFYMTCPHCSSSSSSRWMRVEILIN
jgi:hypothetical protein